MTKLEYTTPCMSEEIFAADEYVAACWKVACARAWNGDSVENAVGDVSHRLYDGKKGCGNGDNQWITENDDGTFSMIEKNTKNQGDLTCIMTDSNWGNETLKATNVSVGDTVYWITNASDGSHRTWHHYGTVEGNGNHS